MTKFLVLILILIQFSSIAILIAAIELGNPFRSGRTSDRDSLLKFLSGITDDGPRNSLDNWRSADTHTCNWTGITCHPVKHCVVVLDLGAFGLQGVISPALAELSFLEKLNLSHNFFDGTVPIELASLPRLKVMSLGHNLLRGPVPAEFGLFKKLEYLDLGTNQLTGVIPPALANLSLLTVLDLSENFLENTIPSEFRFLSRLKQLSLASNSLDGPIPAALGFLKELYYLDLGTNMLRGSIPDSLFCNCTKLQYLDLSNNSLDGAIPFGGHCRLDDLRYLLLWSNRLEGSIPRALSNSSKLKWIDLESNYLSGVLPSDVFDNMPDLKFLYLSYNNLSGHAANANLHPFFASLRKCTQLQELELAANGLRGALPPSIRDLSINLRLLHLEDNFLFGPIPRELLNLINLTYLNLSNNFFNGSIMPDISRLRRLERFYLSNNLLSGNIPASIGEIQQLGLLDMSRNMLSGSIPDTLSNLTQLRMLMLHNNQLSGTVPPSLGKCTKLEILDLSNNQLTGRIPGDVAGLRSLSIYLNLSSNSLNGPIPVELSKIDMILALDLSSNNLSGPIPPQLGSCIALEYLNLSSNSLKGTIPSLVGALPYLKVLDVSSNRLEGTLPDSLRSSSTLKQLNLSFNDFSGQVPNGGVFASLSADSFLGNPELCGLIPGMPSCRSTNRAHPFIILPIILTLAGLSSCMLCIFGYPIVKKRSRMRSILDHVASMEDVDEQSKRDYPRISYRQLVEATGGFLESNLIGSGRFGQVYKGILADELRIAVKVLTSNTGGKEVSGSFKRECEVLKRTRHRNLIKIITTCSKPDFKALVLPLMPNGNLDSHLYHQPDGSSRGMSLIHLVSIASDVAEGLAYLHHYSPYRVVHCDLKPSNVLLDDNMTAVVSDFGISRLVKGGGDDQVTECSSSSISTSGLLYGSVGYIAPEYGLGGPPSIEGDVYSFGVLLLEMITGKRPTDVLFREGLTLREWVKNHLPYNIESTISQAQLTTESPLANEYSLSYDHRIRRDLITGMTELGLVCSHSSPSMRPNMVDVAHGLTLLKQDLSRHCVRTSSMSNSTF